MSEMSEAQEPRTRQRGRPRAPVLTREKITRAALKRLATYGHQAFTLEALARDLKVSPSALYNHAASKAAVEVWMQEEINATINTSCFTTMPAREAVLTWARSYRDAYAPYPMLIPSVALQPIAELPQTLAMYDTVVRGLTRAGLSEEVVLDVVVAVEAFVFGSALSLGAPSDVLDTGPTAQDVPDLTAAVAARQEAHGAGRKASDVAFELGLTAMLDGLPTPSC